MLACPVTLTSATPPHAMHSQVVEASSAEAMREKEENGELPGANRADSAPKTRKVGYGFSGSSPIAARMPI